MAVTNPYLTFNELGLFYDTRQIYQLSNDTNSVGNVNQTLTESLIDFAAEATETALSGAYSAPIFLGSGGVPFLMKELVAAKTVAMLYGRRGDLPKWVEAKSAWWDKTTNDLNTRKQAFPDTSYQNGPVLESSNPAPQFGLVSITDVTPYAASPTGPLADLDTSPVLPKTPTNPLNTFDLQYPPAP